MRLAVITLAYGYRPAVITPFLRSLNEACPQAELVVLRDRLDGDFADAIAAIHPRSSVVVPRMGPLERRLRRLSGSPRRALGTLLAVYLSRRRPRGADRGVDPRVSAVLHLLVARFFYAFELLTGSLRDVDRVLLTDARDVIFQADPFAHVRGALVTGLEGETIGRCRDNRKWIERVYGRSGLAAISSERIACAGVTLGDRDRVVEYLESMCSEASSHLMRIVFRNLDQAIHNWLVHMRPVLGFALAVPGGPDIATLSHSRLTGYVFDPREGVLTEAGERVAVVHQYDRIEALASWVRARWGGTGE